MIKKIVQWQASFLFLFFGLSNNFPVPHFNKWHNKLCITNTELWLTTGTSVCARSSCWGKKKKLKKIVPQWVLSEEGKFHALCPWMDRMTFLPAPIVILKSRWTAFWGHISWESPFLFLWAVPCLVCGSPENQHTNWQAASSYIDVSTLSANSGKR